MSKVGRALIEGKGESPDEKSYKIYAVTFGGHYLEPVRKQFILNGRDALRRRVIVIDFDLERSKAHEEEIAKVYDDSYSSEKVIIRSMVQPGAGDTQDLSEGATSIEEINSDVLLAIEVIQRELQLNADVNNTLNKEREFNIVDYWFETLRQVQSGRHRNSLLGRKSLEKETKKIPRRLSIKDNLANVPQFSCTKLFPRRHNKVGRPKPLISRKFVEDAPDRSKIFIIIVGSFDNRFFLDLLRFGEPLQAIFNFLPGETAYELLVPNPERQAFVETVIEDLEENITDLRTYNSTKPTGFFRYFIPLISNCRAERESKKIYDQLCWAFYDVEALHQRYEKYYVTPYQTINVKMPNSVKPKEALHRLSHLYLQGNYLMSPIPGVAADIGTILLYLDMLLTTIGQSDGILTEWEMVLLSTPLPKRLYALYKDSVEVLAKRYTDAFHSITKLKKVDRLFVEANNQTLVDMVQYVDHERFRHIYLTCLEYKVLRKYFNHNFYRYPYRSYRRRKFSSLRTLPKFVRLYMTNDGVSQRLQTLMSEYDIFDVRTIQPQYNLYNFKRNLNEVTECNRMYVLPSCLCFRDFTLYQLQEFLEDLVTPELLETNTSSNMSDVDRFEMLMRRHADDYNPDIFIRPKSLKAQRMEAVSTLLSFKSTRRTLQKDTTREREIQMATEALIDLTSTSGVGLPPNHPLLIGYNLDDIRQEIWIKTSKYFFEEGNLQLYEERWCFTDTNKNLSLKVNDKELTLSTSINNLMTVQPRLRLTTKNDIAIRFHENSLECAKIVLNYPNGLSVYYEEHYVEQFWSRSDTPNNEKCRKVIPFAAVIVEYIGDELIVIMRYNGEIYRLYQYEISFNEEELEESGSVSERSFEQTLRGSGNMEGLIDSLRREPDGNTYSYERPRIPKEARISRRIQQQTQTQLPKKRNSRRQTAQDAQSISLENSFSLGQSQTSQEQEKETIVNELEFLKNMMKIYGLSYKHLIVITSEGRVFNVMLDGTCYETIKLTTEEWHDYFANESYSMREDGLRMIWGSNYLKCYHSDGTIITTTVDDVYHQFEGDDDFTNVFSQSSSHMGFDDSTGDHQRKGQTQSANASAQNSRRSSIRKKKYKNYEPYLKTVGETEEDIFIMPSDPGYVLSNVTSQCVQHANYACVYFLPQRIRHDIVHFMMEVKGLDDIVVHRVREHAQNIVSDSWGSSSLDSSTEEDVRTFITDTSAGGDAPIKNISESQLISNDMEHLTQASFVSSQQSKIRQSTLSSVKPALSQTEDSKIEEEPLQEVIKIWIGNDFSMILSEDHFELSIVLQRNDHGRPMKSEKVEFHFSYAENLQDIFQKFVARISAYKKYNAAKSEQVFFLENSAENCESKGIEFMHQLPDLGEYNNSAGNTITVFSDLKNIMDKFKNNFEWFKKDMSKFPRFPRRSKKSSHPLDSFPRILDVNIFLKVPHKLRSIDKIHKFADPLNLVNFKKARYQIKETMSRYIHPHIAKEVKMLYSHNSWQHHHVEQERRRLIEKQRIGLYQAILRHKSFPNYFNFMEKYQGKIKLIDYFDYCLEQCVEKPKVHVQASSFPRKNERSKILSLQKNQTISEMTPNKNIQSLPSNLKDPSNIRKVRLKWHDSNDD